MTVSITGEGVVTSTSGNMDFSSVIRMDSNSVGNVTIPANKNAGQFGPVTITGTLTVPSTSSYHVIG